MQVCQILEYKLWYNVKNLKTRLVEKATEENSMGSFEFIKFFKRSLNTVSIDLMGISLIVLKKKYAGRKIKLHPYRDNTDKD